MSITKVLYQSVLRRPSRFFAVIAVTSLFFERTIDIGIENLYDSMNRGVSNIYIYLPISRHLVPGDKIFEICPTWPKLCANILSRR